MKTVRFENGNFAVSISTAADSGEVKVQADGVGDDFLPIEVEGSFSPDEAREIASYLIEMADQLDAPRGLKAGAR